MSISVGIPAYNEEKMISQLLSSVLEQATDGFVLKEIVVNARGSTDNTGAKVRALMRIDSRIRLISGTKREGKAAALNSILRGVKGDVVVFIDGDVVLEEQALSTLVQPFLLNSKVGICSGNTMPLKAEDGFFDFASLFIRSLHHELCAYLASTGQAPKVNGTFYAVRRNIVDAFPHNVVSDDEYASWRAQKMGYHIVYVQEAMVYTRDPSTFLGFIEWQRRIIAGQMYMKRHFGYQVPTMQASVAAPHLFKLLNKHRKKLLSLLTLFSLGALSFLLAFVTFLRNQVPYAY
jgi:cellulose synthase/poly-beta-1,6-N-acetylglucosamine synthase-like glycosyltransferase